MPGRKFEPGEVIISELTPEDLPGIAEGYYASFSDSWFDKVEPPHLRPDNDAIRQQRFAIRMRPWLSEPHTRWSKATLHPSSPDYDASNPDRIIGHAGWLLPGRTQHEILNFWRRDASERLGWAEKMGWSAQYEEELWSGTDMVEYQEENLVKWDRIRAARMEGRPHWLLAPLWVLPEHQGRGVATLLLQDGIDMASKNAATATMYLEAAPDARTIYEHFGFHGVDGEGSDCVMIREPPPGVRS